MFGSDFYPRGTHVDITAKIKYQAIMKKNGLAMEVFISQIRAIKIR